MTDEYEQIPEIFEATHTGYLEIVGGNKIYCAVLKNGKRVISQTALFKAFDRPRKGEKRQEGLPSIIGAKNLLPYVTDELRESCKAIHYFKPDGKPDVGYDAILIPLVCDLYLEADQAVPRILVQSQEKMVEKAKILVRSLAKVGITALIDEATGYQYDREKNELQQLLSKYIAEEFLPWTSRFPREYYQQIFRLYGWKYDPLSLKRTPYIGKFTNQYVYEVMSPEILEKLREVNPSDDNGKRKRRHHQHLTEDIGITHLERHLDKLITVMKLSDNVEDFKQNFQRAFKKTNQLKLKLEDKNDMD